MFPSPSNQRWKRGGRKFRSGLARKSVISQIREKGRGPLAHKVKNCLNTLFTWHLGNCTQNIYIHPIDKQTNKKIFARHKDVRFGVGIREAEDRSLKTPEWYTYTLYLKHNFYANCSPATIPWQLLICGPDAVIGRPSVLRLPFCNCEQSTLEYLVLLSCCSCFLTLTTLAMVCCFKS